MSANTGGWGTSIWQMSRNVALGAAEYMTPVLAESQFGEKGVLTPQEFLAAGELLVLRCPTWQWQAGDPAKARPFLPPDKQFLITRNVPCMKRARFLAAGADEMMALDLDAAGGDPDEWVATHAGHKVQRDDEAPDMEVPDAALAAAVADVSIDDAAGASSAAAGASAAEDFLEEDELLVEAEDPSAAPLPSDNIMRTRTYDVSITYDKYYQCGRVWLYGYSEARQPLSQAEVLEDVSADHALKTVTMESHPHISHGVGLHVSIHPCKHAEVMHKLCSELVEVGRECRPDQYLFLFLKFISCVIPTIEYDYTLSFDGL